MTADRFAPCIGPVAQALLGAPNRAFSKNGELRFGTRGSLAVDLDKGTFFDFEANTGGGVLDLVTRETGLVDGAAAEWLKAEGFIVNEEPKRRPEGGKRRIVAQYPYHDETKTLLYQVVRFDPKDFLQRRPDGNGWSWSVKGVRRVPYRLPDIRTALDVFIVEGEKDADRLHGIGIHGTCNAGGALKWTEDLNPHFAGKGVYIIADNDEPGRKHAQHVAAALHPVASSVKVIELPGLPHKGDVSDWLDGGGSKDELVRLAMAAKVWSATPDDAAPVDPMPDEISAADLLKMSFPPLRYVVEGYLVEGLTFLGGRPKLGKSWLALDFSVAKAMGGYALGSIKCDAADVYYMPLEDNARRAQSRLRQIVDALPSGRVPDRLTLRFKVGRLDEGLLDTLEAWRKRVRDPQLVIIDVLAKVRPARGKGEDVYSYDYRCAEPLQQWAMRHGIAVVVVHHVRKAEAEDPLEMLSGSNGLSGAADTVLVLARNSQGLTLYARGRDIEEVETAVEREGGLWRILGDAEEVRKSSERRVILAVLRDAGEPMGPTDIATAADMKYENARRLLSRMAKDGEVTKEGRGRFVLNRGPIGPNGPIPRSEAI